MFPRPVLYILIVSSIRSTSIFNKFSQASVFELGEMHTSYKLGCSRILEKSFSSTLHHAWGNAELSHQFNSNFLEILKNTK